MSIVFFCRGRFFARSWRNKTGAKNDVTSCGTDSRKFGKQTVSRRGNPFGFNPATLTDGREPSVMDWCLTYRYTLIVLLWNLSCNRKFPVSRATRNSDRRGRGGNKQIISHDFSFSERWSTRGHLPSLQDFVPLILSTLWGRGCRWKPPPSHLVTVVVVFVAWFNRWIAVFEFSVFDSCLSYSYLAMES